MLSNLKARGITILVSTPYMDEANRCDRIALCNEGSILSIDTPKRIVENFNSKLYGIKANTYVNFFEFKFQESKIIKIKHCVIMIFSRVCSNWLYKLSSRTKT